MNPVENSCREKLDCNFYKADVVLIESSLYRVETKSSDGCLCGQVKEDPVNQSLKTGIYPPESVDSSILNFPTTLRGPS